jgi:hypothetical protein
MKGRHNLLPSQVLVQAAALVLALVPALAGRASARRLPLKVDLRQQQTPIRDQGQRGTCAAFAVVAAMEAAYKRAGYGDLNLSEEFAHDVAKMMYLDPPDAGRPGNRTEDHVAVWGGGNAVYGLHMLCHGLALPEARFMPYRLRDYPVAGRPDWKDQFVASSFNLDPLHLPPAALRAPRYFSVEAFRVLPHATDPRAVEQVLRQGHEVVWSFTCAGDRAGPVWKYTGPPGPRDGAHAALLVGYDRTDPAKPYFILKNSWGPTRTPGAGGFTYVAYDYLNYGTEAAYVTAVSAPRPRPAFAFLGRWRASFPGHAGVLDLYRVPGVVEWLFRQQQRKDARGHILKDRRLGTFYEDGSPARAYRVNGAFRGDKLVLTIDWARPSLPVDQLGGYRVALAVAGQSPNLLRGSLAGAGGAAAGASARRLLSPEAFEGRPPSARTLAGLPELAAR